MLVLTGRPEVLAEGMPKDALAAVLTPKGTLRYRTLLSMEFDAENLEAAQKWYDHVTGMLDGRSPEDYRMREVIEKGLSVLPGNATLVPTVIRNDQEDLTQDIESGVFWTVEGGT